MQLVDDETTEGPQETNAPTAEVNSSTDPRRHHAVGTCVGWDFIHAASHGHAHPSCFATADFRDLSPEDLTHLGMHLALITHLLHLQGRAA